MRAALLSLFVAVQTTGQITPQSTKPAQPDEPQLSIPALEPGTPIARELAGGQSQSYRVALQENQLLHVVVALKGIEAVVTFGDVAGKQLMEVNSPFGDRGDASIVFISEMAASYVLSVRTRTNDVPTGHYTIRITELRQATEKDHALQEATRLIQDVERLWNSGQYDSAFAPSRRALAIRETALGAEHPDTAEAVYNLAMLFRAKGDDASAEPLLIRALAINEKALGDGHPNTAVSLDQLGELYRDHGDYAKAEPLLTRALAIRQAIFGPDHPATARSLSGLALLYQSHGEYSKAEPLLIHAAAILERTFRSEPLETATSLENLGSLYFDEAVYTKAEPFYIRALAIRTKVLGEEHPVTAGSLSDLALLYRAMGDYAKAEPLLVRALKYDEKRGAGGAETATSLNNLATLYVAKGEFAKAEPLLIRALAIRTTSLGAERWETAQSLNNLGMLYRKQRDYAKAEPLYIRALAIRAQIFGDANAETAQSVDNLAALYRAEGDYAKAEPLHIRALGIYEKISGPDHPATATSLNNLALLYYLKGEYAKAEPLFTRALVIREKVLGAEHPDTATSLGSLAALYRATGAYRKAVIFQTRCNDVLDRDLARNLASGSERQKLTYLEQTARYTDLTISLHAQLLKRDENAKRAALEIVLRRKGRALDAMTDAIGTLRLRASAEDQELLKHFQEVRSQLSVLTLRGPRGEGLERHKENCKALEDEAENLQNEISERSAEFRAQAQVHLTPVTIAVIQNLIPRGAALIEFAQYRPSLPIAKTKEPRFGKARYVAYVLRSQGEPLWVELGDVQSIDRKIDALRKALRDRRRPDVKQLARALDARVMQPVRRLLGGTKWLLISPDGALNLVPFAALVDAKGHYLVLQYQFTYLTSGRDLLRLQVSIPAKRGPLIVANPDFGTAELTATPRKRPVTEMVQAAEEQNPTHLFTGMFFRPLPGTAGEGKALHEILLNSTLLTQRQATKAALKQVDGPQILHIATHGFFLENREGAPDDARAVQSIGDVPARLWLLQGSADTPGSRVEDPLLRSGLALAGANEHRSDDDGILTAFEVSGLPLWGTKLVVLSACDTGVGEVKTGDGVYGLRRALVLAGSESQIMSLWPVDDRTTRDLMIDYYKALQAGEGRGEALRNIQLKMLRGPKRKHPAYWAGFIQLGQWRNLAGTP